MSQLRESPTLRRLALLTGLLAVVLGGLYYIYAQNVFFKVIFKGKEMGVVADKEKAKEALRELQEEKAAEVGVTVKAAADIKFEQFNALQSPDLDSKEEIERKLAQELEFKAAAVKLVIDGEPVVYLENQEQAQSILDQIKEDYRSSLQGGVDTSIHELKFREEVEIREAQVPPSQLREPAAAKEYLRKGTDKEITHVVERGESLWTIAHNHDMTVEEVKKANPSIDDPKKLQIGEELSLIVPDPYLTIYSRYEVTYMRNLGFSTRTVYDDSLWPWEQRVKQSGSYGKKRVTIAYEKEGQEVVKREVVDEKILERPKVRIIVQGSRTIPPKGTGTFRWPLVGRITSHFGPRWGRFHQGIDIAAPRGTVIKAADGGVVVLAGWRGGYGRVVKIDHGRGERVTVYAHLSSIAVSVGQEVSQGEVVGRVGDSGRSTGAHLHFEVHINGKPVNPIKAFKGEY